MTTVVFRCWVADPFSLLHSLRPMASLVHKVGYVCTRSAMARPGWVTGSVHAIVILINNPCRYNHNIITTKPDQTCLNHFDPISKRLNLV